MKHLRVTHWVAAVIVGVAATTASSRADAAKEVALGATYDTRLPLGSSRRVLPNASFAGLQVKWDFYPLDALSAGVEAQYHLFQRDVTTDTVTIPDGAVTATTFRYASLWSILPTVRYHFFARRALRPYVALGAGLTAVTSAVLVSDLSQRDLSTAFILQPSAGVLWRLTPDRTAVAGNDGADGASPLRKPLESMFGLTASVTYAFTTADIIGASNIANAGIQIGIYAKP